MLFRSQDDCGCAGETGYPRTLDVLVEGVKTTGPEGQIKKYLRRIPADPFGPKYVKPAEQWGLRSYNDGHDSGNWNGEDVYDVYSMTEKKARDGSYYADW